MSSVKASSKMIRVLLLFGLFSSFESSKQASYDDSISFVVFNNSDSPGERTTFDRSLESHGCDSNGDTAFVVHGYKQSTSTPWVIDTVRNLLVYRGGCVITVDYSNYSMVDDYGRLILRFNKIADVLFRKVQQVKNYDRLYMFCFSYGSRLCFDVGTKLGNQVINRIDACDPAAPGFRRSTVDPKLAAKNVACINTSTDKGTSVYNCHQNFLMGICGKVQPGATEKPLHSHGLCPLFYNAAFVNKFTIKNLYNCSSLRSSIDVPTDLQFGYLNQNFINGEFFVPTSKESPWNDINSLNP